MDKSKRISKLPAEGFLQKRARPNLALDVPNHPLIEEVLVSFECRYFGKEYCEFRFTNEKDEWDHIIKFHSIVAARHDLE